MARQTASAKGLQSGSQHKMTEFADTNQELFCKKFIFRLVFPQQLDSASIGLSLILENLVSTSATSTFIIWIYTATSWATDARPALVGDRSFIIYSVDAEKEDYVKYKVVRVMLWVGSALAVMSDGVPAPLATKRCVCVGWGLQVSGHRIYFLCAFPTTIDLHLTNIVKQCVVVMHARILQHIVS